MLKFFILFFPTLLFLAMAQAEVDAPGSCTPVSKVGVGIVISRTSSGDVFIDRVLQGKPAEKHGLAPGDQILGVVSTPGGVFVPAQGSKLEELVDLIRGDEGTLVVLDVLRGTQHLHFPIVREKFDVMC
ncbi:MAG: PDZ domain-containing protein [Bdellovibrionales bacterium]|nr:PDZ domain-containing protein [Bdellovibrionales bacterium]